MPTHALQSSRSRRKAIVMLWSHVTSHVIDPTWSGPFQIIPDPASRVWLSHLSPDYLIFQIKLPTFGSNFQINILNQPFESTYAISLLIKSASPLASGTWLPLTNIRTWESTPTFWGMYDSGSWPSYRSPTRRSVTRITLEHSLVAVWMKALLNAARISPLCRR